MTRLGLDFISLAPRGHSERLAPGGGPDSLSLPSHGPGAACQSHGHHPARPAPGAVTGRVLGSGLWGQGRMWPAPRGSLQSHTSRCRHVTVDAPPSRPPGDSRLPGPRPPWVLAGGGREAEQKPRVWCEGRSAGRDWSSRTGPGTEASLGTAPPLGGPALARESQDPPGSGAFVSSCDHEEGSDLTQEESQPLAPRAAGLAGRGLPSPGPPMSPPS